DDPWRDPPTGTHQTLDGHEEHARPRHEAPPRDTWDFPKARRRSRPPRPTPEADTERHFTTPMDTGRFQALMRARARLREPDPQARRRTEANTPPPLPPPSELRPPPELPPPPEPDGDGRSNGDGRPTGSMEAPPRPEAPPAAPPRGLRPRRRTTE